MLKRETVADLSSTTLQISSSETKNPNQKTPETPVHETLGDLRAEATASGTDGASDPQGTRKRGRPRGSKNRARAEDAAKEGGFDARVLQSLVSFPFNFLGARRGPHWFLTEPEAVLLSDLSGKIADKWMGALAEKWGLEIAFTVAISTIVGSRVITDLVLAREAEQQREKEKTPQFVE